jgi:uncharacterized protein YecE (DUF72 family)
VALMIRIGTAGWSIPRASAGAFPGSGSHLERYARVLPCAEINSSFYRPHAVTVYERWAASTPPSFRFSVKLPRAITHEGELRRAGSLLNVFFGQVAGLGPKLGALLVQLPPSLVFNPRIARSFFTALRTRYPGPVVCEPRHRTWFERNAQDVFVRYRVAGVATDPSRIRAALRPGGWLAPLNSAEGSVVYYRLHGSPRKYWSRYPLARLRQWAGEMADLPATADIWWVFDNTASGAAIENALEMMALTSAPSRSGPSQPVLTATAAPADGCRSQTSAPARRRR